MGNVFTRLTRSEMDKREALFLDRMVTRFLGKNARREDQFLVEHAEFTYSRMVNGTTRPTTLDMDEREAKFIARMEATFSHQRRLALLMKQEAVKEAEKEAERAQFFAELRDECIYRMILKKAKINCARETIRVFTEQLSFLPLGDSRIVDVLELYL